MPDKLPIVFLPGIMGSRLFFETSKFTWDPDDYYQMYFWTTGWFRSDDDNRRTLHFREPASVISTPGSGTTNDHGRDRGWGGVVWSYYSKMLTALRDLARDREAYAIGYDWRQKISDLGATVAVQLEGIRQMTQSAKIHIATHSMGGLVLRAALLQRPDLVDRIGRVLFICPPTVGASVLYRRVFTGLIPELDGSIFFRVIMGNNRVGFVGNMSGLPGAMMLLPSQHYPHPNNGFWHPSLAGGMAHDQLYGNDQSPPGLFDPMVNLPVQAHHDFRQRIDDVAEFHRWLGEPNPNVPQPDRWLAYGTKLLTEVGVAPNGPPSAQWAQRTDTGDGTVPEVSALALGLPTLQVQDFGGLEHENACQNDDVIEYAQTVFQ